MALKEHQKNLIKKSIGKKGKFADPIAPSDSSDLNLTDANLYVGKGGNLLVTTEGDAQIMLANIPDGTFIDWIKIKRVHSKGTTASLLVAIY